ncbi:5'/3'-nucleotidase SurE [Peloplasma aerotolerans]|uniref:5'-nucleotidase SurE n=1 Tax=Peloplasma aerotolerans TaxID=3044389 RepID=A0AAW6UAU7_9MOLU|nr:5'/3'-nucleotidase SurE [Mariniplasma sp. M4Ah]MDI6452068.1 5'/3'-nucleotidase SurE [Mariniplasma sp. M4Ah]MDR4968120.1 5'/3'-nucleotidase SurE [Acholeplasmataceae bacterium]
MNILVVNDDGYQAQGLEILVRALQPYGNIYVSAPKEHQSAKSHSITIKSRIETFVTEPILGSTATLVVDGTPADATRLGLKVFNVDFDLVVSGINYGPNIAKDILYSGTVAAAMEAKILGVDAIAISAPTTNLPYLYDETIKLMDEIIEAKLYEGDSILNINFPKETYARPKGVKITVQGLRLQHAEFIKSEKPDIFHIQSSIINYQEDPESDVVAFDEGYISITPLTLNRSDYQRIKEIFDNQ